MDDELVATNPHGYLRQLVAAQDLVVLLEDPRAQHASRHQIRARAGEPRAETVRGDSIVVGDAGAPVTMVRPPS